MRFQKEIGWMLPPTSQIVQPTIKMQFASIWENNFFQNSLLFTFV